MAKTKFYQKTIVRYFLNGKRRTKDGQAVTKATPGARAKKEKSKTWRGTYQGADGQEHDVPLGDDKDLARQKFVELVKRARREAAGDIDPFEDHRKRPLVEHVEEFENGLLAKGVTEKQAGQAAARCRKIIEACRFEKLVDLSPSAVANYLRERRQKGMGIQSSNHYLAAIKSFVNWAVKDRRLPSNPLAHLGKLNVKLDVRRERRALSADELGRVIEAAARSAVVFRGLDGRTREMLYRVAAMTGLRANELASLTPESFDLDAAQPIVTLKAAYSKHRREDVLPLRADLVTQLREWFVERKRRADEPSDVLSMAGVAETRRVPLFPGTWPEKGAKMLRIDMEAARKIWIDETKGNVDELKRRSESSFLCPVDDAGCVCDFHGLRHTFVSNLAAGGVHPKVAQQLARHSTIGLTMDRYTHLGLVDMTAALEALPSIAGVESVSCRATGTMDADGEFCGCTKGCFDSGNHSRFQPLSTMLSELESENENPRVSPSKTLENTGLSGAHPAGLEPATFGSVDRCSIQLS